MKNIRKISWRCYGNVFLLASHGGGSCSRNRAAHALMHGRPLFPATVIAASRLCTTRSSSSAGSRTRSNCDEYATTNKEIERLALASASKLRGSKLYYKAWRHWSEMAIHAIRQDLIHNLPHAVEDDTTTMLKYQLGMAADYGTMPSSFACAGARSGYAVDFFCRARLLGDLMMTTRNSIQQHHTVDHDQGRRGGPVSSSSDFMLSEALEELWTSSTCSGSNNINQVCRLTSIGGGPGYDFVAAALVTSFRNSQERIKSTTTQDESEATSIRKTTTKWSIHATILDYEEGWYDLVDAMSQATTNVLRFDQNHNNHNNGSTAGSLANHHHHVAVFGGKCDITKPIGTHPSNRALLLGVQQQHGEKDDVEQETKSTTATTPNLLDVTDIWTIQYCVAENAQELTASNFVFFHDLFQSAKVGAIFVITEVTHRLWPDLVHIAQRFDCYQITFQRVRRKGGYHLVLQKRRAVVVPAVAINNNTTGSTTSSSFPAKPAPSSVDHHQLALLRMFELDGEWHQRKIDKGCVRQVRKVPGAK